MCGGVGGQTSWVAHCCNTVGGGQMCGGVGGHGTTGVIGQVAVGCTHRAGAMVWHKAKCVWHCCNTVGVGQMCGGVGGQPSWVWHCCNTVGVGQMCGGVGGQGTTGVIGHVAVGCGHCGCGDTHSSGANVGQPKPK